jgi:hypothetical protein
MKKYKEISNFLDPLDFTIVAPTLLSDFFPWYLVEEKSKTKKDKNIFFSHYFYKDNLQKSNFFEIVIPIIKKINPVSIIEIQAILTTQTDEKIINNYRKDFKKIPENQETAIFYINTNNGTTIFDDNEQFSSKENTLIKFNSSLLYKDSTSTDKLKRILLIFNYII